MSGKTKSKKQGKLGVVVKVYIIIYETQRREKKKKAMLYLIKLLL